MGGGNHGLNRVNPSRSSRWSRCSTSTSSSTRRAACASLTRWTLRWPTESGRRTSLLAPYGQTDLEFSVGVFGLHSNVGRYALPYLPAVGPPGSFAPIAPHAQMVYASILRRYPHLLQDARGRCTCAWSRTLWHHKLYAKASRCQLGRSSVRFLLPSHYL